jgi:hypothetical protein
MPNQAWDSSQLKILMDYALQYDIQFSTDVVGDIQDVLALLIANIESLKSGDVSEEKVSEIDLQGDITVKYNSTPSPATRLQNKIASQRQEILNLLDPYQQLQKYINRARVSRSL